ncbi:glycoside hydrolase family 11 protein [Serendipita vermifera MAFF 305830]|uniref:Endo-1,4-beta-xylanase n=1 Tax=Serendipita vermifera MAFF 305830 TaxID=933852 RepID=A0A0C2W5W6_SERVB|nr:glycoside hydrolase family 11 protein [Serendipita vermifera MAFF 305830]
MVSLYSLFVAIAAIAGVYAAPAKVAEGLELVARAGIDPPFPGYYLWTDGAAQANFTNGPGGQYTITWSNSNGEFIGGKGWNPGSSSRVISYTGTFKPTGNSYLAVYGWTRSPLIQYNIVETYGTYNPTSSASKRGSVTCNGATYDILQTTRINQLCIDGIQTFQQFWSIRNPKKTPGGSISGTVDTACHFNAWKSVGMSLGSSHNLQIFATEGYFGSGTSVITIS